MIRSVALPKRSMRKNLTKEKINAGETAYGVFVNVGCPSIVEILGLIGFDFVLLDTEHGPMDLETCENMIRAADNVNVTPIIRIAMNIQQNILRHFDIGALGVLMPMLRTREDAENVVQSVKYRPEGRRGLAGVRGNEVRMAGSSCSARQQVLVDLYKDLAADIEIAFHKHIAGLGDTAFG